MKRKLFIIFIAMIGTLCLAFALAACTPKESKPYSVTQDGITYRLDGNHYVVSDADESLTAAAILSECEGLPVTTIDHSAFMNCTLLKSVVVPDSITTIGVQYDNNRRGAFYGCIALESIELPDSVTIIGSYTFENCTALKNISLGNGLITIGYAAFFRCTALESITIPENVTTIWEGTFSVCTALTEINYNATNCSLRSYNSNGFSIMAFDTQPTSEITLNVGANVKSIPNNFFYSHNTTAGNTTIYAHKLTTVNFAEGSQCESIGDYAFYDCTSLKNIALPNSVKTIGSNAFEGCTRFTKISISSGVTSIGSYAFKGCTAQIDWGDNSTIKEIGSYAFAGYKGKNFSVPDSIANIAQTAFADSSIINVTTSLNYVNCFSELPIKTFTITDGTSIPANHFDKFVNLEKISLPSTITSIGSSAFAKCESLWAVDIPDLAAWCKINFANETANPLYMAHNLYINGEYAYKITIPETVTAISDYAFDFCTSIVSVTLHNNLVSIGTSTFKNCYKLIEIYNFSSLNVEKGSEDNGYVGQNAYKVYTDKSEESEITYHSSGYIYLNYVDWTFCEVTVIGLWKELESVSLGIIMGSYSNLREYAFYNCGFIKSINVNSTRNMDETTFYGCRNIESVNIRYDYFNYIPRNNLKELVLVAPYISNGEYSTIPYDLEAEAFKDNTKLESVTLDFYGTIGESAFSGCTSLKSVSIAQSSIGDYAFYNCTSLSEITYNAIECECGRYVFANAGIDGDGITVNFGASVTQIPSSIFNVSSAGFYNYSINVVIVNISDSVTSIGSRAFYDCELLTSVTIGNNVEEIGESAFAHCYALKNIIIPESVITIDNSAFWYCASLMNVVMPDSVNSIGSDAFYSCNSLIYNQYGNAYYLGNEKNPYSALINAINTNITSCTIHEDTKVLCGSAFSNCTNLAEINFNAKECADLSSENSVFYNAGTSEHGITVNVGANVTKIPAYIFYPKSYMGGDKHISNPNIVIVSFAENSQCESIGDKAFYDCKSLISVTIPDSMILIGNSAFQSCYKLLEVHNFSAINIIAGSSDNGYVAHYAKIVHTSNEEQSNQTTTSDGFVFFEKGEEVYLIGYSGTQTQLSLPDKINGKNYSIYHYAFYGCAMIKSITIPECVNSIGNGAFKGCSSLTGITIPNSVTSIGSEAFSYCTSIESITIPESITLIGIHAFLRCSSLESVYWNAINCNSECSSMIDSVFTVCTKLITIVIGDNVETIPPYVFSNCDSLESIIIPDSVILIGDGAFVSCRSLTNVTLGNSIESIGAEAFRYCSSLEYIAIFDSVTSIGGGAFDWCTSLKSIIIPDSVTSIDQAAFQGCDSLTDVYYKGSEQDWAKINISNYNTELTSATLYCYSEAEPTTEGNYWHYVDGEIVVWTKGN